MKQQAKPGQVLAIVDVALLVLFGRLAERDPRNNSFLAKSGGHDGNSLDRAFLRRVANPPLLQMGAVVPV